MKKRCTTLLLTLTVLLGLFPLSVFAKEPLPAEENNVQATTALVLHYDDYLTIEDLEVRLGLENLSEEEIQIKQTAPVELIKVTIFPGKNEQVVSCLHAREVGKGTLTIRGNSYSLRVESAPLALFFIIGQSNAEGYEGNAQESVACAPGTTYSSYAPWNQLREDNAADFIPLSLTQNVSRSGKELSGQSAVNATAQTGTGKFGFDGALAWRWNQLTGEKVWTVNAAHNGTSIRTWLPATSNGKEATAILKEVSKTLSSEVDAGHYTLTRAGYFWLQGCDDVNTTTQTYQNCYRSMHTAFTAIPLLPGKKRCLEFGAILMVRGDLTPLGQKEQSAGLILNGPRSAQYLMAADRDKLSNVYLVSDLGDAWITDAAVAASFQARYGMQKNVNYVNHLGNSPKVPTTLTETHPDVHYRQMGHNELGLDAAENLYYTLEPEAAPKVIPTVTLKKGGTYEDVAGGKLLTDTLTVIPIVHPTFLANRVTYEASGLTYENGVLSQSHVGSLTVLLDGAEIEKLEFQDPRTNMRSNIYSPALFRDIPQGEWFTDGIADACELGLMRGINALDFSPTGEITLAETVALAARIHKAYYTDDIAFTQVSEDNWFRAYLDYAYCNGIISPFYYTANPRMVVTRAQFVQIMAGALPDEALPAINDIKDGSIVGLHPNDPWQGAVYKLYRAGVLTGNIIHTFESEPSITRAEAAAIVSRMAESDLRKHFTLE